jgi:thiol-disulfide isomerase/thioredoxin
MRPRIHSGERRVGTGAANAQARRPPEGDFPSLAHATAWFNSPPLAPDTLRGKVVLVQFWTYSCINWMRTLPYVRAWADRYRDDGLVVIGVHAPEFGFEKDIGNLRRAARDLRIAYPGANSRKASSGTCWPNRAARTLVVRAQR